MPDVAVGSEKEGYLLEILGEEVFLTVYQPAEGMASFKDLTLLCAILKKHEIKDYKLTDIVKIVNEHDGQRKQIAGGAEQTVAREVPVPLVEISKDKMQAVISFNGEDKEFNYDKNYIMQLLSDKKISYGINESNIDEFIKTPFQTQIIAEGKAPINGDNAYIKRHIDFSKKGAPATKENGKVNYKDLNLYFVVTKGTVLAERIPQTKGESGMNVLGQEIACRAGKPIPLIKGKNTEIVDDNTLVAAIDGQAIEENNRISVDPKLDINGDVDLSTGNINFNGSVFIKGSVQDGFTVKAEGDVNIGGVVGGGTVIARNIYIDGGVLGMRHGKITAQEDVHTTFAENAYITAERDIYVVDVAMHSKLNAGRRIIVKGRRGQIVGGHAIAGILIDAGVLGNIANVSTKIEVGINPIINERYTSLLKEYETDKKQLRNITNALNSFKNKTNLSLLQKEKLGQLKRVRFPLAGKIERNKAIIEKLAEALKNMSNAKIRVDAAVHPGVKVTISPFLYTMQTDAQHCSFVADKEHECVKLSPY
ncbi:DUF342 domain-containing protein [Pectinatus frisingensis]|uniref:DUF342 domain-containing protein n=1 Tax=Pectinatus frisingensis TaxID=865 RepID=UPI0018C5F79B|nr:FapA family protein [Pectinatus frisingensis]